MEYKYELNKIKARIQRIILRFRDIKIFQSSDVQAYQFFKRASILIGILMVLLLSFGGGSSINQSLEALQTKGSTLIMNQFLNKSQLGEEANGPGKGLGPLIGFDNGYSPTDFLNNKLFLYKDRSTYILAEDNLLGKTVGDLASMGQTEDDIKAFIDNFRQLEESGKLPKEVSLEVRKTSPYGVKVDGERYLFFDEALQSKAKIIAFNDPAFAFNYGKDEYFDFLLTETDHSINSWRKLRRKKGKSYSKIHDNLKSIYSIKNLQTLSESFPSYESEGKKLAAIIMDLIIWDQISEQVSTQVRAQAWTQVGDEVWAKVFPRVAKEVGLHVGNSIRNQIWAQIWEQIRDQVGVRVGHHVLFKIWTEVRSQVEDKVNRNLKHLKFAAAHREGSLSKAIESAIDYSLTVYQLGAVVIRHSLEVIQIQDDLARFISVEMEGSEIESVLANLKIPESHKHYIIDNQLRIVRSHLVVQE